VVAAACLEEEAWQKRVVLEVEVEAVAVVVVEVADSVAGPWSGTSSLSD